MKQTHENCVITTCKTLRESKYPFTEAALFEWLKIHRAKNVPLNSPIKLNVESEKVNNETVRDYQKRLKELTEGYSDDNIYYC